MVVAGWLTTCWCGSRRSTCTPRFWSCSAGRYPDGGNRSVRRCPAIRSCAPGTMMARGTVRSTRHAARSMRHGRQAGMSVRWRALACAEASHLNILGCLLSILCELSVGAFQRDVLVGCLHRACHAMPCREANVPLCQETASPSCSRSRSRCSGTCHATHTTPPCAASRTPHIC